MPCLLLFWVPVLETWIWPPSGAHCPLPSTSVSFPQSQLEPSCLSTFTYHITGIWGSLLCSSHSWHTKGETAILCVPGCLQHVTGSSWLVHSLTLSNHVPSSASLFFESLLWYIILETLHATERLYLYALVSLCIFPCPHSERGVSWVFSQSSIQSTNTPFSVLSIVLGVETQHLPLGGH